MQQNASPAQLLASLPEQERSQALESLTDEVKAHLAYHWPFWARPNQLAPAGDWLTWLVLAGRGFGKTRCGAEFIRDQVMAGKTSRIALVAETQKDLEEVMVFGDSGIASVFPAQYRPTITKKPIRIQFHNGVIGLGYNATEPDQLRGPQFDLAWLDELAKWRYARETWDMLQFGMRLGTPRQIITTTPRPIPLLKEIMAASSTIITRGSTYDNASNLAPSFFENVVKQYEGSRLGRQELNAEVLDDLPGALWSREMFDKHRATKLPEFARVVVAIDPSGTAGNEDDGDWIGIVVAAKGVDGRGYVLADRSCKMSPDGWGKRAVAAYREFRADRIVAERNFGGAMVEHVIRTVDRTASYKEVVASRGKVARSEPVAALYEQGRISHVGAFPELEDQMCLMAPDGYAGEGSPDRLDAAVWALTDLLLGTSNYTLRNL